MLETQDHKKTNHIIIRARHSLSETQDYGKTKQVIIRARHTLSETQYKVIYQPWDRAINFPLV